MTCDLCNPKKARKYISEFRVQGKKPDMVKLSNGREVYFNAMTDEDAVEIAHGFFEMEKEAGLFKDTQ